MATVKKYAIISTTSWNALTQTERDWYDGYYTTISGWETACENLTTNDSIWEGHLYADGEWSESTGWVASLSPNTGKLGNYMLLTAASGQSYAEAFDDSTDDLDRWGVGPSSGVRLYQSGNYADGCLRLTTWSYASKLNLVSNVKNGHVIESINTSGTSACCQADKCLLTSTYHSSGGYFPQVIALDGSNRDFWISNSIIITEDNSDRGSETAASCRLYCRGCTFLAYDSHDLNRATYGGYAVYEGCAILWEDTTTTGVNTGSNDCATNWSTMPGTSHTTSLTITNCVKKYNSRTDVDAYPCTNSDLEDSGYNWSQWTNSPFDTNDFLDQARTGTYWFGAVVGPAGSGGGGDESPSPLQKLDDQFAAVSAAKINGVLQ